LVVIKVPHQMHGLIQGGIQAIQEIEKGSRIEALKAVSSHDFVATSSVHDPQQMWRPLENPTALVEVPVARPAQGDEVVLAQHLGLPAAAHASWGDVVPIQVSSSAADLAVGIGND
jgi:hypothetical protein